MAKSAGGARTVLVVDDDSDIVDLTCLVLERGGYHARSAGSTLIAGIAVAMIVAACGTESVVDGSSDETAGVGVATTAPAPPSLLRLSRPRRQPLRPSPRPIDRRRPTSLRSGKELPTLQTLDCWRWAMVL